VPSPVQPRVVGEDLHSRPDDEDHQKQIEKMLRTQPCRKGRRFPWADLADSGVLLDEHLHRRQPTQVLCRCHRRDQDDESDREQPEQVEPLAVADAHTRCDAGGVRHRTRPRDGVDDVRTWGQLCTEAVRYRRSPRGIGVRSRRCRRIGGVDHRLHPNAVSDTG